jgi:toxin ParE1/3/4
VEAAAGFIARDSPHYAVVLQREAQAAARSLSRYAMRGRVVPERNDERLRELLVGSYRLLYQIASSDEVRVIAFIHGARDLDPLIAGRPRSE